MGKLGFIVVACFMLTGGLARAADETLWQIGNFDQSAEEFDASFSEEYVSANSVPADTVYRVGKSDWEKDWPGFHPGSANGFACGREHPSRILFSLTQPPRGVFTLSVGVLHYLPRYSNLRVSMNGRRGLYFLHPRLSYELSYFPTAFFPHFSHQQLEIELSPRDMKQGENELVLTWVDDPREQEDTRSPTREGVSGIHYDALRLTRADRTHTPAAGAPATLTPTIFYKQQGNQLLEIVEAIVRLDKKTRGGRAVLEFGGKRYAAELAGGYDFGEQRVQFEVPEWSGAALARLRLEGSARQVFNFTLEPARRWTVYVVPHTHLDVGYTDYQSKVAEGQPRVLEQAAEFIRQNPDFRFSMDASWNLEQLLATRSKAKQEEILGLVREGKLAVPAQYMSLLTGFASQETLIRSFYPSKALARRFDLPFDYANITDVPSYSGAYPSILASAGIRYLVAAGNNWRAPFLIYGRWNEKSPFWWEGPDGKKVLVWYARHYMQVQSMFGLPPSLEAVRDSLPVFLQAYDRPDFKSDAVLVHGTQVENTDLVPQTATFVNDWNRRYAYPRMQYGTFTDFMRYTEKKFGEQLPTYRGDAGPYWEDGIGSDAYFAAMARASQSRALSAEILASVTHTVFPSVGPPRALVEDMWRNLILFAEHTWTAWLSIDKPDHDQAVKQLEVKDNRATQARLEVDDLLGRSMSQLADQIHVPSDTLVVFNSLNWRRDALVEADLLRENAKLRDLKTGQEVSLEVLTHKDKYVRVRFLASDLPPVGYKCYSITYGSGSPEEASASAPGTVVENRFYRLTLDPASGAVAGIYDKELQKEIVDQASPYKFGQYLYVSGGDADTRIIRYLKPRPPAELTVSPAGTGAVASITKTPFGHSIKLRSSAPQTPRIDTEILLFDHARKIEFIEHVEKESTRRKEGVYFAFPVAVAPPQFAYALHTGWVNAPQDLLKGASLEWFNIQS